MLGKSTQHDIVYYRGRIIIHLGVLLYIVDI